MNRKRGAVHRIIALHHAAVVIDANQIRDLDLTEMNTERIHPKGVGELRVTRGDMPGHTLIKPKARESSERTGKSLLAVQSLFFERREGGNGRQWPRFTITQQMLVQLYGGQLGVVVHRLPHGLGNVIRSIINSIDSDDESYPDSCCRGKANFLR